MKSRILHRSLPAFLLCLSLVFSGFSTVALSEETAPVEVDATASDQEVSIDSILIDDDTASSDPSRTGLDVDADNGHSAVVSVDEYVIIHCPEKTIGVAESAGGTDSTADVTVNDSIVARSDTASTGAVVEIVSAENCDASLTVSEGIASNPAAPKPEDKEKTSGVGLIVDISDSTNCNINVNVAEHIDVAAGGEAIGIIVSSQTGGANNNTISVNVGEGVSVDAHYGTSTGVQLESAGSEDTVQIGGAITASGRDHVTGASVNSFVADNDLILQVGDGVKASSSEGYAYGLDISNSDAGSISVQVDGDVEAEGFHSFGIQVQSEGSGSTDILVNGGLSTGDSEGYSHGLSVWNQGGEINAEINGDISSTGSGDSVGVTLSTEGEKAADHVVINGNISAVSDAETDHPMNGAAGITIGDYGGDITLEVNGDVTADYAFGGDGITLYTGPQIVEIGEDESLTYEEIPAQGHVDVTVVGDVTGNNSGLTLDSNPSNPSVTAEVIIDGTLSGDKRSIQIMPDSGTDNITLTVWKVEENAEGNLAENVTLDSEQNVTGAEQATDFEKTIQYIIRLDQPAAGATLGVAGASDYRGYLVAHEGDNIILRINLQQGYEIVDAYNGTDTKVSLLKDAKGNYYLSVPRGGGVELSVKLRKNAVIGKRKNRIVFDPNEGTINGNSNPQSVEIAKYTNIRLWDAPEREGYTFLGWYGTEYPRSDSRWQAPEKGSKELIRPGKYLTISQDTYYFTAIWEQN